MLEISLEIAEAVKRRQYLYRLAITELGLIVATHAHADHIGGFLHIAGNLDITEVWYNGQFHSTLTFQRFVDLILGSDVVYHEPVRAEVREYGDVRLKVFAPRDQRRRLRRPPLLHNSSVHSCRHMRILGTARHLEAKV